MSGRRGKGIGILSGGLDSILAVKVLQDQELDLLGVIFSTPFFGPKPGWDLEKTTGIPVRTIDIGEKHLAMLQKPLYGYGSQMNPCIDCHALMLREAGKLMEQENADFLFTGEVLGQRPMSQRRDALRSVEKLAGHPGRVVRPLSAKLLPPTIVEQQGLVDRERLLDIHGRSRKRQLALAQHYGIKDFPQPGGGCMLTKEGFVKKLRELFQTYPHATLREVELLKWGRHFRLPGGSFCIVGRNQADNEKLQSLAQDRDVLLEVVAHTGPSVLIVGSGQTHQDLHLAAAILVSYSDAPQEQSVQVESLQRGEKQVLSAKSMKRKKFEQYLI